MEKMPAGTPMSPHLLQFICCPTCRGSLQPQGSEPLIDGKLACTGCKAAYSVSHGVPILVEGVSDSEKFTAKNFGEQWAKFDRMGGLGIEFEERQFYEYLHPIPGTALEGKTVLEAGCGYGRNLLQASKSGAKVAIGFDIGPAAYIAKRRGCDVVIGDILNPPFRAKFDVVFSFGVMHHVSNPEAGLRKLHEVLANPGLFCHSVYSAENNWFLEKYFTPIRMRFLRHWSAGAKYALAILLAVISYPVFWVAYRPISLLPEPHRWASTHLFYYEFMMLFFKKLGFINWINQLYDHINAPYAVYISKSTIEAWMSALGLTNTYLYFRNGNAWNFGGSKSPSPGQH